MIVMGLEEERRREREGKERKGREGESRMRK